MEEPTSKRLEVEVIKVVRPVGVDVTVTLDTSLMLLEVEVIKEMKLLCAEAIEGANAVVGEVGEITIVRSLVVLACLTILDNVAVFNAAVIAGVNGSSSNDVVEVAEKLGKGRRAVCGNLIWTMLPRGITDPVGVRIWEWLKW